VGTRPNGAAERAGIGAGDILQQLGTAGIETSANLLDAVRSLKIGSRPLAVVWRQDGQLTVTLEISEQDLVVASMDPPVIALPDTPQLPYRINTRPVDAKSLLGKVSDVDTAVWVDADVLNIVHRDAREAVVIGGTFQLPMNRVPGTDVWALQLEMKGWERSFFSYTFVAPGTSDGVVRRARYFFGPDAIPLPEILESLRGKVSERTLHSQLLKEDRKVSVYLPPGARRRGLPVLFMADGQATVEFARVIEPLITSGLAAPFAIVGIHAPPSRISVGKPFDVARDRRSQEYLPDIAPDSYARHMRFFLEEVVPWTAREYEFSSAREDRAVFGFSSGAAFAAAVAVQHPDVFANALPFSIGFPQLPARPTGVLPRFHLIAGELEPDFAANTRVVREILAGWGADVTFDVYMSGHDQLMWQSGLAALIPRVFPISR
jgi:enterochelin esterase-like enzyme